MNMTLIKVKNNEVIMNEDEKELFIKMIERFLELMPNVYRKRNKNWVVVSEVTYHGKAYSKKICEYLGIESDSYEWKLKYVEE